jgi:hypothetical protein
MDEVKMADLPSTKVQGRAYGASKPEPHPLDVMKGPTEKQLLGVKSEKKKKFSEMVNLYQDGGMKSFMEALSKEEEDEIIDEVSKEIADYTMDVIDAGEYTEVTIGEEASQDEFNAEIEKAKAKSQGKVKAEVAKAAVQAVKQEGTEITDEMIFEVLENAGIDFESLNDYELQEVTNEAYEILDELSINTLTKVKHAATSAASDASREGDEGKATKRYDLAGKASNKIETKNRALGLKPSGQHAFEEVEQIDELSKDTLGSYLDKKKSEYMKGKTQSGSKENAKDIQNMGKAHDKMKKESVQQIEERHMTDAEMAKREKIVKSMKKGLSGFKDRYGDRAKNVMYATANKQAMKD